MALPANWSTVTVTGSYLEADGGPAAGSVEFVLPVFVVDADEQIIARPSTIVAALDEAGQFSVTVPASNDPHTSPAFRWVVVERLIGIPTRTHHVTIPYDAGSVDLADLLNADAPVAPADEVVNLDVRYVRSVGNVTWTGEHEFDDTVQFDAAADFNAAATFNADVEVDSDLVLIADGDRVLLFRGAESQAKEIHFDGSTFGRQLTLRVTAPDGDLQIVRYDDDGFEVGTLLSIDRSAIRVGINTPTPTASLDINSSRIRLRSAFTPANATAAGNQGEIAWDASFFYICTATNTWRRVAHASW